VNPEHIPSINRILKRDYERYHAPIVELIQVETGDPFKVLVATILSARTRDETTAAVCRRLFKKVKKPADLARLTVKQIEKLIFPIGFYRNKAKQLKKLPAELDRLFDGRVPDEIDDLCQLPGVGRKTANLVRSVGFDKAAICVDVHVHRISNRLGLVKTRDPFDTEMALRELLPKRYWKGWNRFLVSFGQRTCLPRDPKCDGCPIYELCARKAV